MKVVFDLDDTLADCHHRVKKYIICPDRGRPYRQDPIDWDAFFKECVHDTPIVTTVTLFQHLFSAGHDIRIWTGRSAAVRAQTIDWIFDKVSYGFGKQIKESPERLLMRADHDRTDDDLLKPGWMDSTGFVPDLVFEDRTRVVQAWRKRGIRCFQVADGDF